MSISAFTFARNADKLYYPIEASIISALPIVDEFIVALGNSDPDDCTNEIVEGIKNEKVKIFNRTWNPALFLNTKIFAHEADFGLSQCKGDWCLHLQADEVLHEDDLPIIAEACTRYKDDLEVDGMLLDFIHFWGDYNHHVQSHNFHNREIRIVRNHIGCHSHLDSISFRKTGGKKLNVVRIPARIFHYGYVRPPERMMAKSEAHHSIYRGQENAAVIPEKPSYSWGPLGGLEIFKGTHPTVMKQWIARFNWAGSLDYKKPSLFAKSEHQHLKPKYRLLSWLENNFNNGEQIFGYSNYKLAKKFNII